MVEGVHRITLYDMASKKAQDIQAKILELAKKPLTNAREYNYWTAKLRDMFAEKEMIKENLVCLRGRSVVAARLGGDLTYTGTIDDGAVGTGSTAPAESDTQLTAEVYRKPASSYDNASVASGIIVISFFYSDTDFTNASVAEFGTFIDGSGTGSPNTGRIFSHFLFPETINKTAQKTLSVDATYTIL